MFGAIVEKFNDPFLSEVYGSLTLDRAATSGHTMQYFFEDFERVNREAFGSLGAIFARADRLSWEFVTDTSRELATAFEKWLDEQR